MATTMRAIDIKAGKGPATSLFLSTTIPKPIPQSGQALVKVKYFGLNRMDLTQPEGNYQVPPQAGPILGVEFAGIISSFGDTTLENDNLNIGDEVFGLAYGAWEIAAGIPEVWITATQAMSLIGRFKKGKSILWHTGASSVSIAGIQLSKKLGASAIYATVGSEAKVELCKGLGATEAWNYRATDWEEEVKRTTSGKGVDVIVDFVGQDYFQKNLNSAAKDGCVVIVGLLSGPKTKEGVDLSAFVKRRIRVEGSRLRSRDVEYQGVLRDMLVRDALPGLVDGSLKVLLEKVFDWKDIVKAHQLIESNTIMGKIICKVT